MLNIDIQCPSKEDGTQHRILSPKAYVFTEAYLGENTQELENNKNRDLLYLNMSKSENSDEKEDLDD